MLWKHDAAQPAGTIDELWYDHQGQLKIRAIVTHEQARSADAFSVRATVLDYEIKDADTPQFHALITRAELEEISLTDCPANPQALVTNRHAVSEPSQFYQLMQQKVAKLAEIIALVPRLTQRPPPEPPPSKQTEFSQLVERMNQCR